MKTNTTPNIKSMMVIAQKAVIDIPCGSAAWTTRAIKARKRASRQMDRLTRMMGEHEAHCLCRDVQRQRWLASF